MAAATFKETSSADVPTPSTDKHSLFVNTSGVWKSKDDAGTVSDLASSAVADADYGDITVSSTGTVWTIDNDVVTNAKMANVATATIKGRVTAGTGDPEDLTGTQATTLLDAFTSGLKGLAPASGGGTTNYLRADGTWAAPPGSGGSPGGSNTQVQWNNSSAFGGITNLTTDGTNVTAITVAGAKANFAATATGYASINMPHGTAPTSPVNGDVWTTTAGMYVRINGATVGPLAAGGGGLTNWTDGVNSSSPNATVPVVSLTATNAATNVDAAIIPKGSGALLTRVPDGTSTSGNKRGSYAVDLQMQRTAAAQVASTTGAAIGGGANNTASGQYSAIPGGYANTASGARSAVSGGDSNTATQDYASTGGGYFNTATATYARIGGGYGNNASASYSGILGGQSNTASGTSSHIVGGDENTANGSYSSASGFRTDARSLYGIEVRASGRFSSSGDAQMSRMVLRIATTNATPTVATADAGAAGAANQLILRNNMAILVRVMVVARNSSDRASFEGSVLIYRGANAASTTIQGSPSIAQTFGSAGASAWTVGVSADTTNGGLAVTVTGAAATNINWVARLDAAEVG